MNMNLRQLIRNEIKKIRGRELFDEAGNVHRTRTYNMNESAWTQEQEAAVKKLDLEFEKFLKRRGLDRYSKDANDLWRTAGFKDRMRNIFGKDVDIRGRELFGEAGKLSSGNDDPCWKGYEMVGTKMKNGREVPNCVPKNEGMLGKRRIPILREGLEEIPAKELKDFTAYMNDFYGSHGIYPYAEIITIKQVKKAISGIFKKRPNYEWGGGDSVDREFVRDELIIMGVLPELPGL